MRKRRFLAALLVLMMLFTLLPASAATAFAEDGDPIEEAGHAETETEVDPEVPEAEAEEEIEAEPEEEPAAEIDEEIEEAAEPQADPVAYDLWVCDVRVTDDNKNGIVTGVSFDPATSTLTIQGNVGNSLNNPALYNGAVIYSELPDLIITTGASFTFASDTAEKLIYVNGGNLTLKETGTTKLTLSAASAVYGIYVSGGDLTIDCHMDLTFPAAEYGICVENGNLLLDNVLGNVPVVFLHEMKNGVGIFNGSVSGSATAGASTIYNENNKRENFSAPTLRGLADEGAIIVTDGDLSLGGKLTLRSNTAKYGVYAPNGAVTSSALLSVALKSSAALAGIHAENGFSATANTSVQLEDVGTGILSPNGAVTITGDLNASACIGVDCAGGDVTVTGSAWLFCGSWAGEAGIRTSNGFGVELGSLGGLADFYQVIDSDGDVHVIGDVAFDNNMPIGGKIIRSANGKVVCDGNVTMGEEGGEGDNFNFSDEYIYAGGADGIYIAGDAFFNSNRAVEEPYAFAAPNGPIVFGGNLTMTSGGLVMIHAKGDITVAGDAVLRNDLSQTTVKPYNGKGILSTEGSIRVAGLLKSSSSGAGVCAYKDITVGGEAIIRTGTGNEHDYVLKAETGEITVGGKLTATGKAPFSVYGKTGIKIDKDATITNSMADSVGMYSDGSITFVSGTWDVDAAAAAIQAKEGIVIPEGYGVTLPENGLVSQVGDLFTVTEADGATVAAHAIISEKVAEITISFDAGAGTVEPATMTVRAGAAIGELPVPTREKWVFLGWYMAPAESAFTAGTGTQVTAESTFDEDTTVYAHWRLPGDVNGDGKVNGTDVALLATYVKAKGNGVTIVPNSGNIDGDASGRVNGTDVALLATYVKAKGNGVIIH